MGRSIPACAGETIQIRIPAQRGGVYPRVCGGNVPMTPLGSFVSGLSPRVRGKRNHSKIGTPAPGSIPACAGETVYACHRRNQ